MNKYPRKTLLANTFGMFGYVSSLMAWAWIGIVYLPLLLANDEVKKLLIPTPSDTPVILAPSMPMSPLTIIFAGFVTALVLVLTVIALLRAPVAIAKTGKTVTTKAADSVVPLVTHGKQLPAAEKRRLTWQLIKFVKLAVVILPVLAACVSLLIEAPLPIEVILLVSSILSLIAIFWFALQYLSARAFGIDSQYLV